MVWAVGTARARMTVDEMLDEHVGVVAHAVGDPPGNFGIVAEVGKAGNAGKAHADRVELIAAQVALVVHVRELDAAVWVASQQRLSAGGALTAERPRVGGAVGVHRGRQRRHVGCARIEHARCISQQIGSRAVSGHHRRIGLDVADRGHHSIRAGLGHDPPPPQLAGEGSHEDVAQLVHRNAVPRFPWFRRGWVMLEFSRERVLVCSEPSVHAPRIGLAHRLGTRLQRPVVGLGNRGQAEPAEEGILPGTGHPDHLSPAPQRPAPVPLHLPDPIVGRHPALRLERSLGRRRLSMGDAPPVTPDRHAQSANGAAARTIALCHAGHARRPKATRGQSHAIDRLQRERMRVPDVLLTAGDRGSAVSDRVGESAWEIGVAEFEAVVGQGVGHDPCRVEQQCLAHLAECCSDREPGCRHERRAS